MYCFDVLDFVPILLTWKQQELSHGPCLATESQPVNCKLQYFDNSFSAVYLTIAQII